MVPDPNSKRHPNYSVEDHRTNSDRTNNSTLDDEMDTQSAADEMDTQPSADDMDTQPSTYNAAGTPQPSADDMDTQPSADDMDTQPSTYNAADTPHPPGENYRDTQSPEDDDTDKTRAGETLHVAPDGSKKKLRPGEISLEDAQKHSDTHHFNDTDYEEGDPRWGTARFNQHSTLEIKLRDINERFIFHHREIGEITIGRRDPNTNRSPEVDLEPYDALNKGVSRRHASILLQTGALRLIDHGSPNGTYLNGQKLISGEARILRDGDDIRLGHLVVRVTFRRATNPVP